MLDKVSKSWGQFGNENPMHYILTDKDNWNPQEFYQTGIDYVENNIGSLFQPSTSILDFGCGTGRLSEAFTKYFDRVVGVDISEGMLETAKQYTNGRVEYILNKKDDLSIFEDQTFDTIFSLITLQHMPNALQEKYLREFLRILKIEGTLIFQLPACHMNGEKDFDDPNREIVLEMHGMPKNQILDIFKGQVINIETDQACGPEWISFTYKVKRLI